MITSKPASGKITFPAQKTGTATVTVNHRYGGTLEADIDYYDISLGSGNSYFYIGTNNTAVCYTYKIEIYYSSGYTVVFFDPSKIRMAKLAKFTNFLAARARLFDNLHLVLFFHSLFLFFSACSFFAFVIYLHHFKDRYYLVLGADS